MGGCKSLMLFLLAVSFVMGKRTRNFAFVSFMLRKKRGGNMYGICHGHQQPNAI